MMQPADPDHQFDKVILLALLALLLFASPFKGWWMGPSSPWYMVYLFWLMVILLGAVIQRWWKRHDP